MVGRDDHQRVGVGRSEVLGYLDGAVEFDHFEQPAVGVHQVGLLVDRRAFDHRDKTLFVARQKFQCRSGHFVEHRLVREPVVVDDGRYTSALVDLVEGDIHIGVGKQTKQLVGLAAGHRFRQPGTVGCIGESGRLEISDQVALRILGANGRTPANDEVAGQLVV